MRPDKTLYIVFLSMFILLQSCGKLMPASFWKDYKKDKIYRCLTDHDPHGGIADMAWYNGAWFTFTGNEAIHFASKHNWEITDTVRFDRDSSGTEIHKVENSYTRELIGEKVMPGLNHSETIVYIFKTNWMAIKPGNDDQTQENGFVTINQFGTLMTMYHIWGE